MWSTYKVGVKDTMIGRKISTNNEPNDLYQDKSKDDQKAFHEFSTTINCQIKGVKK